MSPRPAQAPRLRDIAASAALARRAPDDPGPRFNAARRADFAAALKRSTLRDGMVIGAALVIAVAAIVALAVLAMRGWP